MKETNRARAAFEDYYQMGPGRSIRKLLQIYNDPDIKNPPTKYIATLALWSKEHNWQDRVRQRDDEIAQAALDEMKERATKTGYALFEQRIHDMGLIALKMFKLMTSTDLYQPQFVREYRGLLSDIAAEMGHRKQTVRVEDWRSEVVEYLRKGKISPEDVIDELGTDLAEELFISAGIPIDAGGEAPT